MNKLIPLVLALSMAACKAPERYLVTLGGYCDDAVYMAHIRDDGSLDPWTTEASYPLVFGAQGMEVVRGELISTGGFVAAAGGPTAATYSTRIKDGQIQAWTKQPDLPGPVFTNTLVATGTTLFSMGGWEPSAHVIYKAELNANGSVGEWSRSADMPAPRDFAGVVMQDGFVWLVGGDASALQPTMEVFYAPVADGELGEWKSTTALPSPGRFGHGIVKHGDRLFAIGGGDTSGPTDSVFFAQVNADGTLGEWNETTALPEARWFIGTATTNTDLYVVAGGGAKGATQSVWSAPFTAEGLGPFTVLESMPGVLEDNRAVIMESK